MDDLVKSLAGSFHVTKEPNSTVCPHPRFSQYKQKSSNQDQDSRRKRLLEIQRSNRLDYLNLVRKLANDDWVQDEEGVDDDDDAEEEQEESMDVQAVSLKKPGRHYKDQLMLSEWLVEVPHDFETEWLTVLCPVARRCLVIASGGSTYAYTKSGYCVNRFPSGLPGGHYKTLPSNSTILDCLYNEAARTYYVLDLMCWNGHPVYDSETEFRFYWLQEKFKEFPSLQTFSKSNPYMFVPLPSFQCGQSAVSGAVEGATFEIDGLLFYHKRSHYTFGSTPLVVWLKPYMVPEILGVPVPASQMQNVPADYTCYSEHLKLVEKTKELQKSKQNKASPQGDVKRRRNPRRKGKLNNVEMEDVDNQEEDEGEGEEEGRSGEMEATTGGGGGDDGTADVNGAGVGVSMMGGGKEGVGVGMEAVRTIDCSSRGGGDSSAIPCDSNSNLQT